MSDKSQAVAHYRSVAEGAELLDALAGLIGLVQLVAYSDPARKDLLQNHRYLEANRVLDKYASEPTTAEVLDMLRERFQDAKTLALIDKVIEESHVE